ncbi:MAG: bifunctional (p)ppGpp synthetase/guanosine-3',5'-bis(diphosphate) 3'-pyrophosphohydrolase [Candidatus Moranbacteria bacterium]|nr:bifunctional (p)ppGpp synthetase/guanosine-3',5'-bis(diphosphate) 3'-pyrophosphohydrolase [Candidatus Moranbacteria bacterium]
MTLDDVFTTFKRPLNDKDKKLITQAWEMAEEAHRGQKRRSGDDYIQHCLATAKILASIGAEPKTVAAGLLHDVPEDTEVTLAQIEKKFGPEITLLVDGITKLSKIRLRGSKEEYFLENLRKMFLAMAADIRVVLIKLADRLHNMRTLEYNPPDKQKRIARETLEIFVPIANRLGIGEIKDELDDLTFKYLEPENYKKIYEHGAKQYKEKELYIEKAITEIKSTLKKEGISVNDIHGRVKRLHSFFRKLQRKDMDENRIYDLIAIRIIVPSVADCYETLGIIHKTYRPMVGRIKDYISLPKPNGYQSLHTTIFGPQGRIIEVQIRTQKMHDESEFGIAAHWMYAENEQRRWRDYFWPGKKKEVKKLDEKKIAWIRQLQQWQKEIGRDDDEFLEGLKIDFFKNHIFAFTPKGDIVDLPEDATPIDFAYSIHSEVGNGTTGAKADGKMVPLDYKINNGQVIEILTTKDKKTPNRDWLKFTRTSNAKSHIRRTLRKDDQI